MKDKHHDELLNDVLAEVATPEFRAASFEQTLHHARRRKRTRRILQSSVAVFVLLVGVFFLTPKKPTPAASSILATKPTAPSWVVHSRPLQKEMIVRSETQVGGLITSSDSSVALIKSAPAEQLFKIIGDEELFSLLDGRPAALVRHGTNTELVFVNPEDQKGFPVR